MRRHDVYQTQLLPSYTPGTVVTPAFCEQTRAILTATNHASVILFVVLPPQTGDLTVKFCIGPTTHQTKHHKVSLCVVEIISRTPLDKKTHRHKPLIRLTFGVITRNVQHTWEHSSHGYPRETRVRASTRVSLSQMVIVSRCQGSAVGEWYCQPFSRVSAMNREKTRPPSWRVIIWRERDFWCGHTAISNTTTWAISDTDMYAIKPHLTVGPHTSLSDNNSNTVIQTIKRLG